AYFAGEAYAMAYERAVELKKGGVPSQPEVDEAKIREMVAYMAKLWPDSSETNKLRMTLGRLEFSQQNFADAAKAFGDVAARSDLRPEADHMSGLVQWDWYKTLSVKPDADKAELADKQKKAKEALSKAGPALKKIKQNALDRMTLLNDAVLAEVLFQEGADVEAVKLLEPLVELVATNKAPADVEQALKTNLLITALQIYIRQNKLPEADKLMDLVAAQSGSDAAGNITGVFLNLAVRLKEQVERFKAAGDDAALTKTVDAFEAFLDRIAAREQGQTIQSLVYIADNFVELTKYSKAIGLLEKVVADPAGQEDANKPYVLRARMLSAKCHSLLGNHPEAMKLIDQMFLENPGATDIMSERGRILTAAGEHSKAAAHWQKIVKRLRPSP
ncbi:MAG: tetratricopeptide repeat protein, partial [Planctomycetia bacterium]